MKECLIVYFSINIVVRDGDVLSGGGVIDAI